MKLTILRRKELYPSIDLQFVGFATTVPVLCRLHRHKQWFFKFSHRNMSEDSSQESVQARKLELLVRNQNSVYYNFRKMDALCDCNMTLHGGSENICEDEFWRAHIQTSHRGVFEQDEGMEATTSGFEEAAYNFSP
jgi:hypothetical protein